MLRQSAPVSALLFRHVLRGVDWALLLVFVLMFVNLGLFGQIPAIAALLAEHLHGDAMVFMIAAGVSQFMSNVPAGIFLAPFTEDWRTLAWGGECWWLRAGHRLTRQSHCLAPRPQPRHLARVSLLVRADAAGVSPCRPAPDRCNVSRWPPTWQPRAACESKFVSCPAKRDEACTDKRLWQRHLYSAVGETRREGSVPW